MPNFDVLKEDWELELEMGDVDIRCQYRDYNTDDYEGYNREEIY